MNTARRTDQGAIRRAGRRPSPPVSDPGPLAEWLNRKLEESGQSITDVAAITGIAASVLSMIRRGLTRQPEAETIRVLAEYFRADEESLLTMAGYDRYRNKRSNRQKQATPPEIQNVVLVPVFEPPEGIPAPHVRNDFAPVTVPITQAKSLMAWNVLTESLTPDLNRGDIAYIQRGRPFERGDLVLVTMNGKYELVRVSERIENSVSVHRRDLGIVVLTTDDVIGTVIGRYQIVPPSEPRD